MSQRFIGTHRDKRTTLDVEAHGDGRYTVTVGGRRHTVDARRFTGGNWSVIIDGQSYDVELEVAGESEADGAYNTLVRGNLICLNMQDERRVRMTQSNKRFGVEGPQVVTAPMPGKVVKILVQVGSEVAEGQPLIIIEAMKMENELRSPRAGKVSAIGVKEGQAIEANAKLVTVE